MSGFLIHLHQFKALARLHHLFKFTFFRLKANIFVKHRLQNRIFVL